MPVTNNGMNFSVPPTKPAPILYSRPSGRFSYVGSRRVAREAEAAEMDTKRIKDLAITRRQFMVAEEARKRLARARPVSAKPPSAEATQSMARVDAVAAEADKALQRAKPTRPSSAPGWRVPPVQNSSGFAEVGQVAPTSGRRNDDPGR